MTDKPDPNTTVTVTTARELFAGGDATVEVTVTHASLPTAVLLNAAAVAADAALRGTDRSHPAYGSAQCGRTFLHGRHDTTAGECAGLDGTEAYPAQQIHADPEPDDEALGNVYEVPAEALTRILATDATQPGAYGQGVRDTLVSLRLIAADRAEMMGVEAMTAAPTWNPIEVIVPRGTNPGDVKVLNLPDDGRGCLIRADLGTPPAGKRARR